MAIAIGIDLGGTNARAAAVDTSTGAIVAWHKEAHADRSPAAVAESTARAVRLAAASAGVPVPAAVGAGVAAQVLGSTGVVLNAPNLGWRNAPFGELLSRALSTRVRVLNDLSAAALGERRFGAARGTDDAILLFVGSGVGSGLILGGRLHEGAGGVAGEVGHVKVRPRPGTPERRCGCGQVSCLEAYAGGHNIAARVREELAAGRASMVRDLLGGDVARAQPSHVEQACARGDAYAVALWDEVAELLGDAAANLATVLNPARLVFGGGVLLACPCLETRVRARLEARISASAARGLSVVRAALGDDAGVVGAALAGLEPPTGAGSAP
jgi:glucokinase